jgi:uncharacterized protein
MTQKTFPSGSLLDQPAHEKRPALSNGQLSESTGSKTIWIDLDNSPHVPFFIPIMDELQRRGYTVYLTARDCFQVCELADLSHLTYQRIGRHYGKHKVMKVLGTGYRCLQLLPSALRAKPALALSHGSRSQLLAAQLAGIQSVIIFDYEFARFLPGLSPTYAMAPELIEVSAIGLGGCKVLKYPGIKEDVYVPQFKPDPAIKAQLGIEGDKVIVTLRPPANEAHYHNPESEKLLQAAIEVIAADESVKVVLVPRNEKQASSLRMQWPGLFTSGKMVIPEHVVDGLNLIWHSDLVISGGGTMNREAAAMDVPVYSIFRGPIGAVDRYLAANGRLVLLESPEDVRSKLRLVRRNRPADAHMAPRQALHSIVDHVVAILEAQ